VSMMPAVYLCLLIPIVSMTAVGCSDSDGIEPLTGISYETRTDPATGQEITYYMGRQIADLPLSEHSSLWLDRPGRNTEELPSRLIRAMQLRSTSVVADVGAGTGYFTFRLAAQVPSGRVLAVDVQSAMLDTIRVRMQRDGIRNITPIKGEPDNPNLARESVDMALIVASYHEFSHPKEMIEHLAEALRPGGHLIIVEYRAEDDTVPVEFLHKMFVEQIRKEVEVSGLVFRETKDILPQQHFVVFEKPVLNEELD
jgi:precorrin-6B methylase 2